MNDACPAGGGAVVVGVGGFAHEERLSGKVDVVCAVGGALADEWKAVAVVGANGGDNYAGIAGQLFQGAVIAGISDDQWKFGGSGVGSS